MNEFADHFAVMLQFSHVGVFLETLDSIARTLRLVAALPDRSMVIYDVQG
jgi:hypothetical protein